MGLALALLPGVLRLKSLRLEVAGPLERQLMLRIERQPLRKSRERESLGMT